MSLIYSVLKPVLRIAKPKRVSMTRNDRIIQDRKIQPEFSFVLPEISGYGVYVPEKSEICFSENSMTGWQFTDFRKIKIKEV